MHRWTIHAMTHAKTHAKTMPAARPTRLLPVLALLFAGASAQAASFDCAAAKAADETAICTTLALNDRDVEMATRFEILKDELPMGGRAKLRDDQEAWLAERRACAADTACLKGIYDARLTVLRAVQSEFSKQGPQ